MPQNLRIFLVALVVIVLAFAATLWWLGAGMANLAFFDTQRDQPFVVIDLFSLDEPQAYTEHVATSVESAGGNVSPVYRLSYMPEGRRRDERRYLQIVFLEKASESVQVFTSLPYRELTDQPEFAGTKVGSYEAWEVAFAPVLVVWLAQASSNDQLDPLHGLDAYFGDASTYGTKVQDIEGEGVWEELLVVAFPTHADAVAWLRSTEVVTQRSLINARTRHLQVAVYERRQ